MSRVGPRYPHVIVLFGATGDLARRKLMPGLFRLAGAGFIAGCRIVGVSLDRLDTDQFRKLSRAAVDEFSARKVGDDEWNDFAGQLAYVPLDAGPGALKAAVEDAESKFSGESRRLHYLSVPPAAALSAVKTLAEAALVARSRVIMEKPFGVDLESSVSLNTKLHEVFREEQIFRIDHFLGKEPAQNILAFRFGNGLFEPIWNRNFIDHVQIDVPETLDLGKRVGFYETIGAYRDMVVTHLFQILAFMAMEPPTALGPASITEEKNKVFRSMLPVKPTDVVRGQFSGYRAEPGVDPESDTDTFIALKCSIDNWRWAGVPFYLRTGKRLARKVTEIAVALKPVPHLAFQSKGSVGVQANQVILTVQPDEGVSVSLGAKIPGPTMRIRPVNMEFRYGTSFMSESPEAYERLILDAMRGDATLFTRNDEIEALWGIIDPIIAAWHEDRTSPIPQYEAGSEGPVEANGLLLDGRRWRRL
jgi:glucose-6-phosphate 1-dehydrogenase